MPAKPSSDTPLKLLPTCGIVMPISSIDGCSEAHWLEIRDILSAAIETAGFTPNLVSHADDVGIIQKRIIQNLYENSMVVCDVSAKNPNVMFELGMRLAFDKPTIIVKDDKTGYTFDTSPIEHLEYPRDLRFAKIVEFKAALSAKIKATHEKANSDKEYTTFLKHFGTRLNACPDMYYPKSPHSSSSFEAMIAENFQRSDRIFFQGISGLIFCHRIITLAKKKALGGKTIRIVLLDPRNIKMIERHIRFHLHGGISRGNGASRGEGEVLNLARDIRATIIALHDIAKTSNIDLRFSSDPMIMRVEFFEQCVLLSPYKNGQTFPGTSEFQRTSDIWSAYNASFEVHFDNDDPDFSLKGMRGSSPEELVRTLCQDAPDTVEDLKKHFERRVQEKGFPVKPPNSARANSRRT